MVEGNGKRENGGSNQAQSAFESGHRRRAELAGGESIAKVPVIGITGGIASGKTTAANFFKKWGACIISGDELGWRVLKDKSVQKKLVGMFGPEIVSKGKIDRKVLGPKVFADKKALVRFNRIAHPPLLKLLKKEVVQARKRKCKAVIIDAALLAEWKIPPVRAERRVRPGVKLDFLLMVHASKKVQLKRLMAKGLSRPQALRRIGSQMPYNKRRRVSDGVLVNSGSVEDLRENARKIWEKIIIP